jgi:hypothetical protein
LKTLLFAAFLEGAGRRYVGEQHAHLLVMQTWLQASYLLAIVLFSTVFQAWMTM